MSLGISAMVSAFGPERELPLRQLVGSSFLMPGRVGDVSGIKVVSVVQGHPAGSVTVFDADGKPIGTVDAELGELLAEPWDRSSHITLFKSVGIASQDNAAAAATLSDAENLDLGTVI